MPGKKGCPVWGRGVVIRTGPASRRKKGSMGMKAKLHITLKNGVLDPQGKAVENALASLGFEGVSGVRQ